MIVQVTVMNADKVKLHVLEANPYTMRGVEDFWISRKFFFKEFERA